VVGELESEGDTEGTTVGFREGRFDDNSEGENEGEEGNGGENNSGESDGTGNHGGEKEGNGDEGSGESEGTGDLSMSLVADAVAVWLRLFRATALTDLVPSRGLNSEMMTRLSSASRSVIVPTGLPESLRLSMAS